jgi:hypothetical protein
MNNVKYIKCQRNQIIVFSEDISHSEFKHFNPKSAGFISFGILITGALSCTCYGRSDSLGMKSDPNDSKLAMKQILGYDVSEIEDKL